MVSNASLWSGLSAGCSPTSCKVFKPTFWTIFFKKNFFWIFFRCNFEISRDVLVSRGGGWYKTLPYEVSFQRFIVRQAIKFFKPTFERFSLKKNFFEFFSDVFFEISRDLLVSRGGGWYQTLLYEMGFQRFIVRQTIKFFKPTFWTIFSENFCFFEFFFRCLFWKFLAMYWFAEAGGGIKGFLLKCAFSGL